MSAQSKDPVGPSVSTGADKPLQRKKSPKRKAPSARKPRPQARDKLLAQLLESADGRALLASLYVGRQELTVLDAVTPPGSLLDTVIRQLRERTDLPAELGLAVVHSMLSAALAQAGSTVQWEGEAQAIELALWTIVLAPSGAGKTFVRNLVASALGLTLQELPEPGSGRVFIDSMKELGGRAMWVRDEYGQLMAAIASGGPLGPLRDLLLRTYDHAKLEVNTKKDGLVTVPYPVLSIFGSTVDSTWATCIDAAMLADGLLARHLFVVAKHRPMSVPLYPHAAMTAAIEEAAQPLKERLAEGTQRFVITQSARELYEELWRQTAASLADAINPAYYRRITWSTSRYAVLYHLLLGRPGTSVGRDAMRWAWRMTQLHLEYARQTLALSDPAFSSKVERIIAWVEQRVHEGADPKSGGFVRDLCRHLSHDKVTAQEARYLIDLARKIGQNR
jgi:hypothetical protein